MFGIGTNVGINPRVKGGVNTTSDFSPGPRSKKGLYLRFSGSCNHKIYPVGHYFDYHNSSVITRYFVQKKGDCVRESMESSDPYVGCHNADQATNGSLRP